ncbi:WD40/YVTN/BNR-like repeat-containing protein [Promineifilum sp.]|uniref:WD40/YVTN/BNR-like repeat-containing protein n=1 Tax=Promineifilum sp. TaxID=2664178 RepID=UPI0035B04D39
MKTLRAILAAALVAALVASVVLAAGDVDDVDDVLEWTRLGSLQPTSGPQPYVSVIATPSSDPAILYAGTLLTTPNAHLIYRTEDGGATWQPADAGLPRDLPLNTGVDALAVHPTDSNLLYVGLRAHGVWRSEDGGASWQSVSGGGIGDDDSTLALTFDPGPPSTVYALTEAGFHVSTNGRAWQKRANGLPPASSVVYNALIVDPTDPDTLYVATNPRGLFRSTNGGKKWVEANGDLPPGAHNVKGIAISPITGELFMSMRGAGLLRSADNAQTWTPSHNGITYTRTLYGTVSAPVLSPTDPMLAYAFNADGIFRSEDGGATWAPYERGMSVLTTVTTLATHPTQSWAAYAGTAISGVWAIKGVEEPPQDDPVKLFVPLIRR